MMAQDKNRLIWIDMEMSGLDPINDRILEVALVVTDSDLPAVAPPRPSRLRVGAAVILRREGGGAGGGKERAAGTMEVVLAARRAGLGRVLCWTANPLDTELALWKDLGAA